MMKGKWDKFYEGVEEQRPYGDALSYVLGATYLKGLSVEDWGCGLGWFSKYHDGPYVGIDGSCSKFASICADLTEYTSTTEGIFMRHVLEHNHDWKKVLQNAITSFQKRMVLIMFTAFGEETRSLGESVPGIPDLSFRKDDLLETIGPYLRREEGLHTQTQYATEHIFYLEK